MCIRDRAMKAILSKGKKQLSKPPQGKQSLKQLITVTTKNGNYFYILIDRDDEGENTVHFLNPVSYTHLVWLFDKVGAAVRLSPGADASAKLLHLGDGFTLSLIHIFLHSTSTLPSSYTYIPCTYSSSISRVGFS